MKPKCLFFILFLPIILTSFSQTSFAQLEPPTINAIPLPVGSGARALGQGGAFIAVADDATAASWNPGGLTQLERPEFSVVGSFLSIHQDWDTGSTGLLSLDKEGVSSTDLNYASIAYPFRVFGKNMVAALNYQQKYDFLMDLDYNEEVVRPNLSFNRKIEFESRGGIGVLTPAIAMQVLPKLSLGVAVNFYTDEYFGNFAWKQEARGAGNGTLGTSKTPFNFTDNIDQTFKNFQAVNVTVGMLLDVWEREEKRLTFGAVYHSPYTADVDRVTDSKSFQSLKGKETVFQKGEHFEIDYPMSFGAGLGFRYSDSLSFSMDITWTDWSKFEQENEKESLPIGGITKPTDREIDDTYAIRCGTEYLMFRQKMIIPIRGGLFYDPRPSLDDSTDVYGFSVGSGITFKRFSIDGAYQFRWAHDVDGEDFGLPGTHFDLTEHLFLASIIVYF